MRLSIGSSILFSSMFLIMSGCGGSSNNATAQTNTTPEVTGTAFYVDAPVEGVTVTCNNTTSTTDAQGAFTYVEGATCSFSFGDILLRQQSGITQGQYILEDVITVAQFLQSLDMDGDASNGITLSADVLAVLKSNGVVTLPENDEALAQLIAKVRAADVGYNGKVVTKEEALAHLKATQIALGGGEGTTGDNQAPVVNEGQDTTGDNQAPVTNEGVDTASDNKAPVAKAGEDFSIEAGEIIYLDGSKSYDSDGKIEAYQWVRLGNEGNPRNTVKTDVAGLGVGKYTFKLTVTDNMGATATDEVVVTVNAKPAPKPTLKKTGQTTKYVDYDDGHYQKV